MALTRPRAAQIYDIDYKQATRVVTVANIALSGGAPSQVDSVNLSLKDRVLVTAQDTASENGIYYVTTLGTGSNGTWTRSADTDATGELLAGTVVMVTEGLIYADTQWKLTTNDPIVIGTTPLTFVQNYSANSISSGTSNVTVLTNSSVLISSAGSANVLKVDSGVITVAGNIVPASNVTYSLGNTTNRFSNLWLSNSTIYLGNVAVGATANTLTVDGSNVVVATANSDIQTTGNISVTGNITGNYFLGNVFFANGITASKIYSGNSEVNVTASGGNVNVSIGGTSNVAVFTTEGEYVTGLLSVSGNVTSGNANIIGTTASTSRTTGALTVGGGIGVAGDLYAGNSIVLDGVGGYGTVTTTQFSSVYAKANGLNATSLMQVKGNDGTNGMGMRAVTGSSALIYSNSAIEIRVGSTIRDLDTPTGGNIIATIASTGLTVNGVVSATSNVIGGNLLTGGVVSATGNATAGNVLTSGLSSATGNVIGGNVTTGGLISATGNATAGNILTAGIVSATGNITGDYFLGNVFFANGITASKIYSGNSEVNVVSSGGNVNVSVGGTSNVAVFTTDGEYVTGFVSVSGNTTSGNVLTGGLVSATGNITGANILTGGLVSATGNTTAGNIDTAGQVSATANITGGNLLTSGLISATGTITGGNIYTGGLSLTGNTITSSGATLTIDPNGSGAVDGNVVIAGNLSVQGNVTYIDSNVITTNEKSITLANNVNTGSLADGAGIDVGNNDLAYWRFNNATTSWQSNIGLTPAANATLNLGGSSNYWANVYASNTIIAGSETVVGNISAGNILTGGLVSATGNVTSGNVNTTNISLSGNVLSALNVTGNVTGSNITTVGLVSATGNVTGGNILTAGLVSATGNVTGNYINGNGSALTGISTFSNIAVTGGSFIAANTISTLLTLVAGNNIVLTANNTSKSLQIDYSSSGGTSIFATGGDMGTVVDPVTSSEDLGDVITESTTAYDLGQLGVDGVVSNSDIIGNTITGDKINSSTYISITGNLTAANLALTSSAVDVRGWWYGSGNLFSVNSQETAPTDVILSTAGIAGTNMYVVGITNKTIYQYSLSTAWQANSASYTSLSANVAAQDTGPQGIRFDDSNTALYMLGGTNKTIYQYTVNYANIATLSYASKSFSVNSEETAPKGFTFGNNGAVLYVVGTTSASIFQYALSIPGDISTAVYTAPGSFSISAQDTSPTGIEFSTDGQICYVVGSTNDYIYQYSLATAWDITTASYSGYKFSIFSQEGGATGLYRNQTAQMAYMVGTGSGTATVWQYNITNGTIATGNSAYFTGQIQTVGNVYTQSSLVSNGNITGGNIVTAGLILATGNIVTSTSGRIGVGTTAPDCELNILANPQTVSYTVAGNSTAAGTDLHISGADGAQTRITQDAFGTGSYVAFTGRSARGTGATPTQTQSGDTIAQFTGRGFSNGSLQFGNASTGRVDVVAAENFTDTSRATNVQIYTTAVSSVTATAIATFSSASGLSVAGNVVAGNVNIPTGGTVTINGNAAVNGPAFAAYANSSITQTITSGTQQKVLFQLETFDTNSNFANSRFTPTVAGYYQINGTVRLDGATGTGECMITLWKNGSEYARGWNASGVQFASNFWSMSVSSLAYANGSSDYFELYVQQTSGANRTVTVAGNNITYFNGCMMRGA